MAEAAKKVVRAITGRGDPNLLGSFRVASPTDIQNTSNDPFGGIGMSAQPGFIEKLVKGFMENPDTGLSPMPMMLSTPVYHGTNQVFNEFVNDKLAKDTLYGIGHYFTDSPKVASGYAEQKMTWVPKKIAENISNWEARLMALKDKTIELVKKGADSFDVIKNIPEPTNPNVHKVFLNIDKPFNVETDRLQPDQLKQLGIDSPIGSLDYLKSRFPGIEEKFPEMLQKLGYDSLQYSGGKMYSGVEPHRVFVVNDPSKIIPAFSKDLADKISNARTLLK
jgi:hypothetical protein